MYINRYCISFNMVLLERTSSSDSSIFKWPEVHHQPFTQVDSASAMLQVDESWCPPRKLRQVWCNAVGGNLPCSWVQKEGCISSGQGVWIIWMFPKSWGYPQNHLDHDLVLKRPW